MKLVVGLGNPGARYAETRHNVGFRIVDRFAERHRIVFDGHEKDAFTGRGRVAGQTLLLAKPQTYMNLSGRAVAGLVRAYADHPSELIVVYDDVDLPLGSIRIRESGSAGTHNGMKSIVDSLGTTGFPRLRFGVRGEGLDPSIDLADYVLDSFGRDEEEIVDEEVAQAVEALFLFARGDLRRAMNQFNRIVNTGEAERP